MSVKECQSGQRPESGQNPDSVFQNEIGEYKSCLHKSVIFRVVNYIHIYLRKYAVHSFTIVSLIHHYVRNT